MDLVQVQNNQALVSSRDIAAHFEKQHKHIIDSIRTILAAENSATNFFTETSHEYRGQKFPEFLMNRDGFSLLTMGFTGISIYSLRFHMISYPSKSAIS